MQPTKSRPKQSISRHPLFPVIAALWTGALLGLGSLAIPGWMIERAVLATHIQTVLPAAAPPLGLTARLLLAMALFCFGAVVGLMATRRRAEAAPPRATVAEPAFQAEDDRLAELEPENPAPRAFSEEGPRILDLNGLNGLEGLAPASPRLEKHEVPETLLGSLRFDAPVDRDWHPASEPADEAAAATMIPEWAETLNDGAPLVDVPEPAVAWFDPPFALETRPAQADPAPDFSVPAAKAPATDFSRPEPVAAAEPEAPVATREPRQVNLANASPLGLVPSDAAAKLKATPLESLGVVELAERLALAISERRNRAAQLEGETSPAAPRQRSGDGFGSLLDMTIPTRALRSDPAEDLAEHGNADWDDSPQPPAAGEMQLQSALAKLQQISSGA